VQFQRGNTKSFWTNGQAELKAKGLTGNEPIRPMNLLESYVPTKW
jgi:hypothetical protein